MIFSRKITLYCNDDKVQLEDIADLALMLGDDKWQVSEEYGSWENKCTCGAEDCIDAEAQR